MNQFSSIKITAIIWTGFPKQITRAVTRKGVSSQEKPLMSITSYLLHIEKQKQPVPPERLNPLDRIKVDQSRGDPRENNSAFG